jgi:outer membrane receptor protein involved in Fe transport
VRASLSNALSLDGDWTFNDAKYRNLVTEEGDTLSGARVFNTARYTGSASLQLAPPASAWSARVGTNVVGPYTPFDEPGVEVGAYALLHAGMGIRVRGALLDLGVRNLLDRTYPELRAGGFVSPGQPRAVFATVRYDF